MDALSNDLLALISSDSSNSTLLRGSAVGPTPCLSPDGPRTKKSGRALAPVSPSPRRASRMEKRTSATSGPISYDSSPSGDLQRSLESKLRARLDVNGSLEYDLIWKHWATESGSPICALRASARRISVKDFTGWPTATTSDDPQNMELRADGDKSARTEEGAKRELETRGSIDLPTTAVLFAGWRSPNASDGQGGVFDVLRAIREGLSPKLKLRDDCQLAGWPTTTTRDCKADGRDQPNRRGGPSLSGMTFVLFLVPTGRRAVLAPEFSLWLMGYPEAWAKAAPNSDAWRAAQAALELEYLKDLETLLSQSSPPSSSEPS